jgi:hypothetical protein
MSFTVGKYEKEYKKGFTCIVETQKGAAWFSSSGLILLAGTAKKAA